MTNESGQRFKLPMRPAAVALIEVVDVSRQAGADLAGYDLWVGERYVDDRGVTHVRRVLHEWRSFEQSTRLAHVHRVRSDENGRMRANFEPGTYIIGIGLDSKPEGWSVVESDGRPVELKSGEPTRVTFRVESTKMRPALKAAKVAASEDSVLTQLYYVGDLVPTPLQHDGSVVSDFALLQQQLKQSVLPKSWSDSGGLAEMEGFPTNQVLVVTHSQAGHHAIARQLAAMRQKLPADK